ncbi:hypothetical protein [Sulfolobus ellipsoid virus 1]|uniref:Uncharacterized protein n=1 Tax=Sulfolobus ellipsoid virus 1 TaxID=2056194 RepID=A0A2H4RBM3_9VIRU|nr:hypothetical protein FGG62_gp07 [Sulfolobus ellipsoid virus 1]ATY46485.1 hypothetical protein [Sulfolobus ellipsoid virus 1]
MPKYVPPEVKEKVKERTIQLFKMGYSYREIHDIIKEEFGSGVSEAMLFLESLPEEVKLQHIDAYVERMYKAYLMLYGEKKAKEKAEKLRKSLLVRRENFKK